MKISESLDIVIPCYNPPIGWAEGIWANIEILGQHLETQPNVIIVNDGSSRNFNSLDVKLLKEKIKGLQIIVSENNEGKGAALRRGVEAASSNRIIFTDVDFPYEIESFLLVLKSLNAGNNVVLGVREQDYYEHVPTFRKILSKSFRFAMSKLLKLKSDDTQCGLKAFDAVGKSIFLETKINRFLFDLEFVLLCSRSKKLQLAMEKVRLKKGVVFSKMPLRILMAEALNFLKLLFHSVSKRGNVEVESKTKG